MTYYVSSGTLNSINSTELLADNTPIELGHRVIQRPPIWVGQV